MNQRLAMFMAVLATASLIITCGGGGNAMGSGSASGSASVEVKAEVKMDIPLADMPEKYRIWAEETQEFLRIATWSENTMMGVKANLAAAFGLAAGADTATIVAKIKDAIKKTVQIKVTAQASIDLRAQANASAGNDGAQANANASAAMSASVKVERVETVEIDPIVKDNWDKIQMAIADMRKLPAVVAMLKGRGKGLSDRGFELVVTLPEDLKDNPTLALKVPKIKAELERGAKASGEADAKVDNIASTSVDINGVLDAKFPEA